MTTSVKSANFLSESVLRAMLASALLFLALLAALIVLKPEIDPAWRFISEYGIGRLGWMMSIAFVSLAASCIAAVIALWPQLGPGGRIGSGFLFIGALGLSMAGIFTTDPITAPLDAQSTSSQLHGLGAILGDGVPIGATLITGSLARNKSWRTARWWMIATVVVVWVFYAWLMTSMPTDGQFGPGVMVGWPSRLLMASYCLWFIVTAWQGLRLNRQTV